MNKLNNTPSLSKSAKSMEENEDEFVDDKKITTIRVLKRGSLNTPISQIESKEE